MWAESQGDTTDIDEADLKALLQSLKTVLSWQKLEERASTLKTCALQEAPSKVKQVLNPDLPDACAAGKIVEHHTDSSSSTRGLGRFLSGGLLVA